MKKKNTHGGARPGSGAKLKYNEQTVTVSFRVPKTGKQFIKNIVNDILEGWKVKPESR